MTEQGVVGDCTQTQQRSGALSDLYLAFVIP